MKGLKGEKGMLFMKRVLLCLMLLLSICASCAAFDPPQPPRWVWAGSNEHIGFWVDTETVRYYTGSNKAYHSSDNCAAAWIMQYNADKDEIAMLRCEVDLNCKLMRSLSFTIYDSSKEVKNSYNNQYSDFEEVIPGSFGESIYDIVERLSKSKGK